MNLKVENVVKSSLRRNEKIDFKISLDIIMVTISILNIDYFLSHNRCHSGGVRTKILKNYDCLQIVRAGNCKFDMVVTFNRHMLIKKLKKNRTPKLLNEEKFF